MSRIPAVTKFIGDNQTSLQQWILQFEVQITALGIEEYIQMEANVIVLY